MKKNITKSTSQILKDNICTVFNLLNLLIAIALAAVGAWKNILFILVIFINTVVGIIQELKAKKQIERLTLLSQPSVYIIRNGKKEKISPDDIVKGDILFLESGSVICSDSIVVSGTAEVNESVLTGEAEPVFKKAGDKLLSGSTIVSGRCNAKAVGVGDESFASQITDEVKKTKQKGSELLLSMRKVTRITSFFIVPLGILLLIQSCFLRGTAIDSAVVSTAAGLLGMLPKGLVLLISIGLAVGVINLSKKNVLVRDLYSLENLAHCDTICLDKTGTLTDGNLTVESVFTDIDDKTFQRLISTYLKYTDDNNSTFKAIQEHFKPVEAYKCTAAQPFSSDRKYSSVTLYDGRTFFIGAPEKLCKKIPSEVFKIMSDGKRVIFAGLSDNGCGIENVHPIGMIVISDTIRKSAESTINYFYKQGIDVKVISGDNPQAAAAAARRSGIRNSESYIDMSGLSDKETAAAANKYTVFGRVTPKQKKILISSMQKKGHNVAMTGDGVNDLLAMRKADCSIAIGSGSDAAKQTAQLVLIDCDFAALKDVISEGRRVVNNLTKSAGVFFIKTIYSVLICILCLILNVDFPFIPIQITLIDGVIEAFPAFFMSFEKNDKKVEGSFLKTAIRRAFPNAFAIFICCMTIFVFGNKLGIDSEQGSLIMYILVGIISLAGVVRASMPMNLLRGILAACSVVGFWIALTLFPSLLQIPPLLQNSSVILPVMAVIGLTITGLGIRFFERK